MQIITGSILGVIIAFIAYRAHSLNKSGAYAAAVIGAIIMGLGGFQWAILLLTFFITSSLLSRAFKSSKMGLNEKFSKGDERDAGQVLANGGLPALIVLTNLLVSTPDFTWVCFAAALAAVNADTWATELGVLNPSQPRMITQFTIRVEKGTSGAISLFGTLASLLGAGAIALLASLYAQNWVLFPIISFAGLAGSLLDSFLGATVQAMYYCPRDKKETEKHPLHSCGTETVQIRGWKWLNNDYVNIACGSFGAALALTLFLVM